MGENEGNSVSGKPSVSDRLEMMWNLSKAARDRFNVRNETEWKICFGLWTAFGVAAGFILNSSSWKPDGGEFAWTVVIVLLIVATFIWFTIKRREFDEKDSQTAYFWESAIEKEIACQLHDELRPGKAGNEWLRFGEASKPKPKYERWHPGLWAEIIITGLFGILVIGAVATKAGPSEATRTVNTKKSDAVDIEANSVVQFSENSLYYLFSTIAQTLAAAIALLTAFVLYRLSILNEEMGWNGGVLAEGVNNDEARTLNGEARYQELLALAERSNKAGRPTEFARLNALVPFRRRLLCLFLFASSISAVVIFASVVLIPFAPQGQKSRLMGCFAWLVIAGFVVSILSYAATVRKSLQFVRQTPQGQPPPPATGPDRSAR